jgi:hypothetical protein
MDINYNKYIKYKLKYLELKQQSGGGASMSAKSKAEGPLMEMPSYRPPFCDKIKVYGKRLNICNIFYNGTEYNLGYNIEKQNYLKANLINDLKKDLKDKNQPFDETVLNTFNINLNAKIDEAYALFSKEYPITNNTNNQFIKDNAHRLKYDTKQQRHNIKEGIDGIGTYIRQYILGIKSDVNNSIEIKKIFDDKNLKDLKEKFPIIIAKYFVELKADVASSQTRECIEKEASGYRC